MKPPFVRSISYLTTQHGVSKKANTPLLIPLDLELQIDGIGGIYPGNSFHSTYLPLKYQQKTVFQAFDVNHQLDSSGWTVTLTGKMRSTLQSVFDFIDLIELKTGQFDNFLQKASNDDKKRTEEIDKKQRDREFKGRA